MKLVALRFVEIVGCVVDTEVQLGAFRQLGRFIDDEASPDDARLDPAHERILAEPIAVCLRLRVSGRSSGWVPSGDTVAAMSRLRRAPEVLAPAGDLAALQAALAAGADAVYFGLREGFNARARTGNFALADLADTVARIHRAGAKAHLAVNTLVFEPELALVETIVQRAAESGVDALIVKDPAVAVPV